MIRRDLLKSLAIAAPLAFPTGRALAQTGASITPVPGRWSVERITDWYGPLRWLVGANYLPSNKINQIDMWQASTWDPDIIASEFDLARATGFNTMRVFLHPLVWEDDEDGLYRRMDQFLSIAAHAGIRPSFVFFDDCHYPYARLGPQPPPVVPAFHNSGWVNAPDRELAERYARGEATATEVAALKGYVQRTIARFAHDRRVLYWELYNEPGRGNGEYDATGTVILANIGDRSQHLVQDSWTWAREVAPSQPITSTGFGNIGEMNSAINTANSDLHSIHSYDGISAIREAVADWKAKGRPVVMTEWLNRTRAEDIPAEIRPLLNDAAISKGFDGTNIPRIVLPHLKAEKVGAVHWGFVTGKSETNWNWFSRYRDGKLRNLAAERAAGNVLGEGETVPEPYTWHHDLYRPDHTPYDPAEIEVFRSLTARP
jgi:hypothetical protein